MELSQENIGVLLKKAREEKKLTQKQLADKVGKKRSYISRIESESGSNIKIGTLIKVVEKGLGGTITIDF